MLKPGDTFRIQPPKGSAVTHWGNRIFIAKEIRPQKVKGYDSDLDLGMMVTFLATFAGGKSALHAVPLDWCMKIGRQGKKPRASK